MKYRRYTREFKEAACKLGADPACGPGQAAEATGHSGDHPQALDERAWPVRGFPDAQGSRDR